MDEVGNELPKFMFSVSHDFIHLFLFPLHLLSAVFILDQELL